MEHLTLQLQSIVFYMNMAGLTLGNDKDLKKFIISDWGGKVVPEYINPVRSAIKANGITAFRIALEEHF